MTPFVVTGTGHCGTAWVAAALSFLGVPTTHEGVFTLAGRRPWPAHLIADVSVAAAPYLGTSSSPPGYVVARDPLDVVNSFFKGRNFARTCPCHGPGAHLGSPFAVYAATHVDLAEDGDELGATIRYVTRWHALAARHAPVVRLEDLAAGALVDWAADVADVPRCATETILAGPWLPVINPHGTFGDDRPWITWADVDAHPDGPALRHHAEALGYI